MYYRYRLYDRDGDNVGEAEYAVMIKPDETIWTGDGRRLRVVGLIATEEESAEYAGILMVEPT
jgi:hypothetical protein